MQGTTPEARHGGASIGQEYIAAALVDEIQIYLVPVFFGSGARLSEQLGDANRWRSRTRSRQQHAA